MEWSAVITACLAFVGTVIGTIVSGNKTAALVVYRLQELEKKVEKHNTIVERTYKLESDMATAFTRIDEIKQEKKS